MIGRLMTATVINNTCWSGGQLSLHSDEECAVIAIATTTTPVYAITLPILTSISGAQLHTDIKPSADTASLTTLTANPPKAPTNHTCLLKTTVATVISLQTEAEANILFDEGSQRSFLT